MDIEKKKVAPKETTVRQVITINVERNSCPQKIYSQLHQKIKSYAIDFV